MFGFFRLAKLILRFSCGAFSFAHHHDQTKFTHQHGVETLTTCLVCIVTTLKVMLKSDAVEEGHAMKR